MNDQLTKGGSQLSRLYGQGIVTHILATPEDGSDWSIDPFSVRNIENLELMVILDDGRVAICCPDGLPPGLAGNATAIADIPDGIANFKHHRERDPTPADDRLDRILTSLAHFDTITSRLDGLEQAVNDASLASANDGHRSDVMERFDDMSAILRSLTMPPVPDSTVPDTAAMQIAERLSDLTKAVDTLSESQSKALSVQQFEAGATALNMQLTELRSDLTAGQDFVQKMYQTDADTAGARLGHELLQMSAKIDALCLAPMPKLEMTPIHQALSRQTTALSTVVRRIETLFANGQAAKPAFSDHAILAKLDALQATVAQLKEQEGRADEVLSSIEQISHDVADLTAFASSANNTWLSTGDRISLRQQLSRHAVANATVLRRLEALADRAPLNVDEDEQRTDLHVVAIQILEELQALKTLVPVEKVNLSVDCEQTKADDRGSSLLAALNPQARIDLAEQLSMALLIANTNASEINQC